MKNLDHPSTTTIKVYHGYGHTNDLIVFGHVFSNKPVARKRYSGNILYNILHIASLFFVKPIANTNVELLWGSQVLQGKTEVDGFFKFEWKSDVSVSAGWHPVTVNCTDKSGNILATGEGKLFVPHITQYGFISDIDDTVLVSHSSTIFKRLRVLFTKNPHTRKAFADVVAHYKMLALAHASETVPNPFFYVSSSEWNLYNDLNEFFNFNGLPKGAFLLNQVKVWHQLFKTGNTKHNGKLIRIMRILNTFPNQKFVLLGDNSQSDPEIYTAVANKFPGKIFAVYIRCIHDKKEAAATEQLSQLENIGVHSCLFGDNADAVAHSKKIGLLV